MSPKKSSIDSLEKSIYKSLLYLTISDELQNSLSVIAKLIKSCDKILIASHAAPDGDALGSTLALAYICKHLKKEIILYNETNPLPDFLSFLPKPQEFEHDLNNIPFVPDLVIVLDCGDESRIGDSAKRLLAMAPSINIDHHLDNPQFGSIANFTDTSMAATANAIFFLALELDVPLKGELATCVYTALVTDTGSFSYSNTNARTLLSASYLTGLGIKPNEITNFLDNTWSDTKNKLFAYLMTTYTFDKELETAYVLVTEALLEELNATTTDLEGFVEHLRKLQGARIAFVLREKNALECKASFRSSGNDDVQKLAMEFKGGGHKNAAAANFRKTIAEARDIILETIAQRKKEFLP